MTERIVITKVDIHANLNGRGPVVTMERGANFLDRRIQPLDSVQLELQRDVTLETAKYLITRTVEIGSAIHGLSEVNAGIKKRDVLRTLGGVFSLGVAVLAERLAQKVGREREEASDLLSAFMHARRNLSRSGESLGTGEHRRQR